MSAFGGEVPQVEDVFALAPGVVVENERDSAELAATGVLHDIGTVDAAGTTAVVLPATAAALVFVVVVVTVFVVVMMMPRMPRLGREAALHQG
jgi:hypothetical protein